MDETVISCGDAKNILDHGRMLSGMKLDFRTMMLYPIDDECACDIISQIMKRVDKEQQAMAESYGEDSDEVYRAGSDMSYVAESRYIPEKCACDIFSELAKNKRHFIRQSVSQNLTIPDACKCAIFEEISSKIGETAKNMPIKTDSFFRAREGVALRRDIPPECREKILAKLVLDPNGYVRKAAKKAYPVKKFSMW